jgi:hypothetical protein
MIDLRRNRAVNAPVSCYRSHWLAALLVVIAVFLNDCTVRMPEGQIQKQFRRIELPQSAELEVHARALPSAGDVLPVELWVTNLAERARVLKPFSVVGIAQSGDRVDELRLEDPAIVANDAALLAEVSGGKGAFDEALILSEDPPGAWFLLGGPIEWAIVASNAARVGRETPSWRLRFYCLATKKLSQRKDRPPNYLATGQIATGYAFLPNRKYKALELTVQNLLTGNDEVITIPWNSAAPPAKPPTLG